MKAAGKQNSHQLKSLTAHHVAESTMRMSMLWLGRSCTQTAEMDPLQCAWHPEWYI